MLLKKIEAQIQSGSAGSRGGGAGGAGVHRGDSFGQKQLQQQQYNDGFGAVKWNMLQQNSHGDDQDHKLFQHQHKPFQEVAPALPYHHSPGTTKDAAAYAYQFTPNFGDKEDRQTQVAQIRGGVTAAAAMKTMSTRPSGGNKRSLMNRNSNGIRNRGRMTREENSDSNSLSS